MFNVAFITLSIVSLVLSAKFRRNLTEGKAKTLKSVVAQGFLAFLTRFRVPVF